MECRGMQEKYDGRVLQVSIREDYAVLFLSAYTQRNILYAVKKGFESKRRIFIILHLSYFMM